MRPNVLLLILTFSLLFPKTVPATEYKIKLWDKVANKELSNSSSELIAYFPADSLRNGISVIICPGGSYHYLGINHEGRDVARWFQNIGITAFVLRYRVAFMGHHHPAMIEDLQRAIQIVRENSDKYKVDPNKLGLIGFSAGGHLVTMAGIFSEENYLSKKGITSTVNLRPDFIVPIYPVVSMQDSIVHKRSRRSLLGNYYTTELRDKLSLELNVPDNMPPVFLLAAKDDDIVDYRNSTALYNALTDKHIPCKFVLFEHAGHGFGMFETRSDESKNWNHLLKDWIQEILHIQPQNKQLKPPYNNEISSN